MTLYCIISEVDSCCFIFYSCFPFPQKINKTKHTKKSYSIQRLTIKIKSFVACIEWRDDSIRSYMIHTNVLIKSVSLAHHFQFIVTHIPRETTEKKTTKPFFDRSTAFAVRTALTVLRKSAIFFSSVLKRLAKYQLNEVIWLFWWCVFFSIFVIHRQHVWFLRSANVVYFNAFDTISSDFVFCVLENSENFVETEEKSTSNECSKDKLHSSRLSQSQ